MHTYEIRNRRTRMILGEVHVDQPEDALNEWMADSGMTLEDIFSAFGGSMDTVRASLDIVEVEQHGPELVRRVATAPLRKALPGRRFLFREAN